MSFNANTFLSKTLGEDFLETLSKTELYKPVANVVIDLDDIRIGLKVVPRVILSLLIRELPQMKLGDVKAIPLNLGSGAILNVNKHDSDTYSGSIVDNGAVLVSFKYRPLPGVGLVIMSAFELYEMDEPKSAPQMPPIPFLPQAEVNIQKLIDERLALHDLVGQVVERKLMEKEAIQKLFMAKIKEQMELNEQHNKLKDAVISAARIASPTSEACPIVPALQVLDKPNLVNIPVPKKDHSKELVEALSMSESKPKKVSPLKSFLDNKKLKKNEFHFSVLKSEIACPDCKQDLIKNDVYYGCICLGADLDNKVYIKKSEDGVSVRFGKSWDKDNIQTLLEILRKKNG